MKSGSFTIFGKAFSPELAAGDQYPVLNAVVAVTICDFQLWPDREPPLVPMLSRWSTSKETSDARGLLQVRLIFFELPKYRSGDQPASLIDKWVYFFRETVRLKNVPPPLADAPFSLALEVARSSGFSPEWWETYDRAKMAEQDARGALSLARRLGVEEGIKEGIKEDLELVRAERIERARAEGAKAELTATIEDLCDVLGVELSSERRTALSEMDEAGLRALKIHLRQHHRWP